MSCSTTGISAATVLIASPLLDRRCRFAIAAPTLLLERSCMVRDRNESGDANRMLQSAASVSRRTVSVVQGVVQHRVSE